MNINRKNSKNGNGHNSIPLKDYKEILRKTRDWMDKKPRTAKLPDRMEEMNDHTIYSPIESDSEKE